MPPARQRLEAGDASRGEVDDRLVVELELAARDGAAQARRDLQARDDRGPHPLLVLDVGAAAAALGPVHRHVGVPEHLLRLVAAPADADARADAHPVVPTVNGCREGRDEALGGDHGVGAVREQHGELVAAEAGGGVRAPQAVRDPARHLDQHLVPGQVAETVVDRLEAVEVEEQHGDVGALAVGAHERLLEPVEEEGAVGKPGERVAERLPHLVGGLRGAERERRLGGVALEQLAVRGAVAPLRVPRGDEQDAGERCVLVHGCRHRGAEVGRGDAASAPRATGSPRRRRPAAPRSPGRHAPTPTGDRLVRRWSVWSRPWPADDDERLGLVGVDEPERDGVGAEELGGALDDHPEDLVERRAGDDRALDTVELGEERLGAARRSGRLVRQAPPRRSDMACVRAAWDAAYPRPGSRQARPGLEVPRSGRSGRS